MRLNKIILVLSVFFYQLSMAGDFRISQTTCNSLATKMSLGAFSPDSNSNLYVPNGLNSDSGYENINRVHTDLNADLIGLCKSDSQVSFESFKSKLHSSCSGRCQKSREILMKDKRDRADSICVSICNKSFEKLEFFQEGYSINNCNGVKVVENQKSNGGVK